MKPGYKTTEFWLSLAAILIGVLISSDVIPVEHPIAKLLGIAASVLGALGYQVSRSLAKASAAKSAAFVEASKSGPTPPSA
jgi:hypothetical protein